MTTAPNTSSSAPALAGQLVEERSASMASQLRTQFKALPRAMRWGLAVVLAIGLYALLNATTWDWARGASQAANLLQVELDKANRRLVVDRSLESVVLAHGAVRLPPREDEGSLALAAAVNEVLKSHKAAEKIRDQGQTASRLQGTEVLQILPSGSQGAVVSREVEFIAPTEVASSILRDLESHPDIDAIRRLEMQVDDKKDADARLLKVKLTVEAWVGSPARGWAGGQ